MPANTQYLCRNFFFYKFCVNECFIHRRVLSFIVLNDKNQIIFFATACNRMDIAESKVTTMVVTSWLQPQLVASCDQHSRQQLAAIDFCFWKSKQRHAKILKLRIKPAICTTPKKRRFFESDSPHVSIIVIFNNFCISISKTHFGHCQRKLQNK